MVFKQRRFTVDLGPISERIQKETIYYMKQQPVILFLPVTYEDAMNEEVIGNIINVVRELQEKHKCFKQIIFGLDTADTKAKFNQAYKKFKVIPKSIVIWNNSPEMIKLIEGISESLRCVLPPGKGRNMWLGLGYRFATNRGSAYVLHDCDILPEYYNKSTLLSLIAPIVHPELDFGFSKAYYHRLTKKNGQQVLSGRVTRLLVGPLVDALRKTYGFNREVRQYLNSLQSFNYPLSGEFAIKGNLADILRVQADWGLEVGTLNFLYDQQCSVAQVDLGTYDHKHSDISPDDPKKGLNKMSEEVAKTILRKIYSIIGRVLMDEKRFSQLLYDYDKYGERYVKSYRAVSANMGWSYDHIKELERIRIFKGAIKRAYEIFKQNPEEIRPLFHWDEIDTRFRERLRKIVEKYNP